MYSSDLGDNSVNPIRHLLGRLPGVLLARRASNATEWANWDRRFLGLHIPIGPDIPIRLVLSDLLRLQSLVRSVIPFCHVLLGLEGFKFVLVIVIEELERRGQDGLAQFYKENMR